MKCIICDKKAEYILEGTSFCKIHLIKQNWNDVYDMEEIRKVGLG